MNKPKKPRRQYKDANGEKLPSVTTILGAALAKPGLVPWAAKIAAEATAEALLDGFCQRDVAIAEGARAPLLKRDNAAELGTRAHAMVDQSLNGKQPEMPEISDGPMVIACYQRAVKAIHDRWTVEQTEWPGVSSHGYGGTLDLICIDNETQKRVIVDLKTGSYHSEHIAQLAAYRQIWHEANPDKPIECGAILHVPVKGDGAIVIPITSEALDCGWEIFKAALVIYRTLPKIALPKEETGIP